MTVIVVLSLVSFYTAAENYFQGEGNTAVYYLMLSLLGIAISVYMLIVGRGKPVMMFEDQKLNTILQCEKCNFKSIREFRKGDYIFKKSDECPKCKEKMVITAIYREVKEEEKEWKI
ncbi:hypothetical protein J7L06_03865 [Candidatus Bathyarchaeota archaeon]|nr:hypothetical protein [Candidatus Bathyarchaeota archaeon]